MHADTGTLTGRIEPRDVSLAPLVGPNTAHVIMRAWPDGNRGFNRVDAREFDRQFSNLGQPFQDARAAQMP